MPKAAATRNDNAQAIFRPWLGRASTPASRIAKTDEQTTIARAKKMLAGFAPSHSITVTPRPPAKLPAASRI